MKEHYDLLSCGVERYVALYLGGYLNPQDGRLPWGHVQLHLWSNIEVRGVTSVGKLPEGLMLCPEG